MKTFQPKQETIKKKWYIIDAKGKILGRLATEVAKILNGKYKVEFTPRLECGDRVVVINAKDIVVTGRKMKQKTYTSYSGYPDGLKIKTLEEMLRKQDSAKVIKHAVKGMLPKNIQGRKMLTRLRVYSGEQHFQEAQKPEVYSLK